MPATPSLPTVGSLHSESETDAVPGRSALHAPLRPRRVLFFGKTKARTCCTGALVDALKAQGLEVRWLNCSFLKRYLGVAGMRMAVRRIRRRFDPDLCFVFYHDLPQLLMEEFARELPTVVWMEEQTQVDRAHIDYVRDVRLLCLSTPRLVREYRAHGIASSTFMLSGFSSRYHQPIERRQPGVYDRDIAFIGGPGHMGDRPEFLAWLAQHHDLEIFGRVEPWLPYLHRYPQLRFAREVRPRDYGSVCGRSRIVLGLNQDHQSAYYFSNRLFLTLACRGFHLTRYVPGAEELFTRGVHLDWFHDREECLERVGHYLVHSEERERIAAVGHDLAIAAHSYSHRVQDILSILAGELGLSCPDEPEAGLAEMRATTSRGNNGKPSTSLNGHPAARIANASRDLLNGKSDGPLLRRASGGTDS